MGLVRSVKPDIQTQVSITYSKDVNNFNMWVFFGIFTIISMNINGGINEHF